MIAVTKNKASEKPRSKQRMKGKLRVGREGKDKNRLKKQVVTGNTKSKLIRSKESQKEKKKNTHTVKESHGKVKERKKQALKIINK